MKQNGSSGSAEYDEESHLLKSLELKIEVESSLNSSSGEEKAVPCVYRMKLNGSCGSTGRDEICKLLKSLELKIEVEESHNSSSREENENISSGSAGRDEESELLNSVELNIEVEESLKSTLRVKKPIPCVYRIPRPIREINTKAYTPGVVSIGPLHRGREELQAMEVEKLRYMKSLFSRIPNSEAAGEDCVRAAREDCVRAMLELEPFARTFYEEEVVAHRDKVELAKMMLIDGCFIIELLFREVHREQIKDFILDNDYMSTAVKNDLLLLENQIPFRVIRRLFNRTVSSGIPLTRYVLHFFRRVIGLQEDGLEKKENKTGDHILSFLRNCFRPDEEWEKVDEEFGNELEDVTCDYILSILRKCSPPAQVDEKEMHYCAQVDEKEMNYCRYSATQLDLAGVKLLPANNEKLFDVKFISRASRFFHLFRRAQFQIPPLQIRDGTELFLRNAIAFEQCCWDAALHFTSYAFLMDKLINTTGDVELLEKKRILYNYLGSPEEVSNIFNNITKNCVMRNFYFRVSCSNMDKYCTKPWPKFLVKLRRYYFGSPWTGISLIAAFILFVLTLMQTIYTMFSYY